jgi:RNA polymerase-associated protein
MILYCSPGCIYSHRIRIALLEKNVSVELEYVDPDNLPEALLEHSPEGETPTLADRELAISNTQIITDYLDERFPHPPLYPMDPVSRARTRTIAFQIKRDWYSLYDKIINGSDRQAQASRKQLKENLIEADPLFANNPFFMSEEFSMVDCILAPLLWRLPSLNVVLPAKSTGSITEYSQHMFNRSSFKDSLTDEDLEKAETPFKK